MQEGRLYASCCRISKWNNFYFFQSTRDFVLSTCAITMVNIDSNIKKGGRKVVPTKTIFYEVFNLEKGFQKDQSAKSKISDNCRFFRKEKFTLVQLAFTINVSVPFVNFLTVFQSEGPLLFISAANKYYFSASHHKQENKKTANQIKFLVVTIKQQIKLILQHSLCK